MTYTRALLPSVEWHGANWTFLVWGCYHGLLLSLHRYLARFWDPLPRVVRNITMMMLVVVGWVFFRSENVGMAMGLLDVMFSARSGASPLVSLQWGPSLLVALGLAAIVAHRLPNTFELKHRWGFWSSTALAALFLLCIAVIYGSKSSPFLYFQF